jgi:starch phosphorylase
MTRLTEPFSSDRMLREYVEQAYLPAARAYLRRAADGGRLATELEQWLADVEEDWPSLRFGRVSVREADQQWHFEVQAYLGDLQADAVAVQIYAEPGDSESPICVTMQREGSIHGAVNGYLYKARVPAQRPAEHYTPRIVPAHAEAFLPMESNRIYWRS